MTPDTWLWLIGVGGAVAGWWVRNWTGPLATFLRRFIPAPTPGGKPLVDVDRLLPDDPNSLLDDAARAILKAILASQTGNVAPPPEKLNVLQRILDLFKQAVKPA